MGREAAEREAAAHAALRHFQGLQPPLPFQLMPRLRQALPQLIDGLTPREHQRPILAHQGMRHEGADLPGHVRAEVGQQPAIHDLPFFVGHPRQRPVQGNHLRMRLARRATRHAQGDVFDGVAVDDQIHGYRPMPFGQAAQGKILRPHAGMKQLRLVSGQEQQFAVRVGREIHVAIARVQSRASANNSACACCRKAANGMPWKSY